MDGIIIKDDPFKADGVYHRVVSYNTECSSDERKFNFDNVEKTINIGIREDMTRIQNECVHEHIPVKRNYCVQGRRETGSRRQSFFGLYGHFRSFQKRLILFSFMMLIHGIG